MTTTPAANLTELLISYGQGDAGALELLMPLLYREMRQLAQGYLRREKPNHTLQPTALVHEAYMKLIDQRAVRWQNRAHFLGVAAQAMRRILIDHARVRKAHKRGGIHTKVSFDEAIHWTGDDDNQQLLALDQALEELSKLDPRQAKVVELRYFGGLSIEETAEVLGSSPATVKRDWTTAKAWLYRELQNAQT